MKGKKIYLKIICLLTAIAFSSLSFSKTCSSAFNPSSDVIKTYNEASNKYYEVKTSTKDKYGRRIDTTSALKEIVQTLKPNVEKNHIDSMIFSHAIYRELGEYKLANSIINTAIKKIENSEIKNASDRDISKLYIKLAEIKTSQEKTTKDYLSAIKDLEIASELGNENAFRLLAMWYADPSTGLPVNLVKAYKYEKKYYYLIAYNKGKVSTKNTITYSEYGNMSAKYHLQKIYIRASESKDKHPLFVELKPLKEELKSRNQTIVDLKKEGTNQKELSYALDKLILTQQVFIAMHEDLVPLSSSLKEKSEKLENDFVSLNSRTRPSHSIPKRESIISSYNKIISFLEKEIETKGIKKLTEKIRELRLEQSISTVQEQIITATRRYVRKRMEEGVDTKSYSEKRREKSQRERAKKKGIVSEVDSSENPVPLTTMAKELGLKYAMMKSIMGREKIDGFKGKGGIVYLKTISLKNAQSIAKVIPEVRKLLQMIEDN